jgi:mRNA-degrading endonuclease RelE of RelBE toxin-antitoxin system
MRASKFCFGAFILERMAFTIRWTDKAAADLEALRKFDQRRVANGVEVHLMHEPTRVSRSRIKLLDQPFWNQYRLRVDDFRAIMTWTSSCTLSASCA